MIVLGLGEVNVVRIPSDGAFRLDVAALRTAIQDDERSGFQPMAVVATVGTTSTTSVDPVGEIAAVCRESGIWLHVDAAYGGAMALVSEGKWAMEGVELADSVVVNPHKWMFVPLDFSALFVRRPELLRAVFSLTPEYLPRRRRSRRDQLHGLRTAARPPLPGAQGVDGLSCLRT